MPNIQQQKKRVLIAVRQRDENLRYRSTIKTLTKRLEAAVAAGDADLVASEHLALVRLIDKSASNGAIHKNTAGRKKAQAARLVGGTGRVRSSGTRRSLARQLPPGIVTPTVALYVCPAPRSRR